MLRSLSLALSIVASLVGCSTPGAFFGAVDGPAFVAHPSADASHATVTSTVRGASGRTRNSRRRGSSSTTS